MDCELWGPKVDKREGGVEQSLNNFQFIDSMGCVLVVWICTRTCMIVGH
jgi:hypothetical protein